jgi:hypothetical protein
MDKTNEWFNMKQSRLIVTMLEKLYLFMYKYLPEVAITNMQ